MDVHVLYFCILSIKQSGVKYHNDFDICTNFDIGTYIYHARQDLRISVIRRTPSVISSSVAEE